MVAKREKERWPFNKRLGFVRIGSQDLVELLKKHSNGGEVSASTKRHNFSSLEDMQENIELLAGHVDIKLNVNGKSNSTTSINVKFAECTTIGDSFSGENGETEIEKLSRELRVYRLPVVGHLTKIPPFLWVLSVLLMLWVFPDESGRLPFAISFLPSEAIEYIILVHMGLMLLSVVLSFIPSVYYNPNETFWQKNRDKVLVGIILLVLGLFTRELFELIYQGSAL